MTFPTLKFVRVALLMAVAVAASACQDLPTGPVEPLHEPALPTAQSLVGVPGGVMPSLGTVNLKQSRRSANKDDLKELLKQEKERLKAHKESLKALHKARKEEWKIAKKAAKKVGGFENFLEFLTCEPLEYDADTDIIGPEGGKLSVGPHKLEIPKGSLSDYVLITAEMPLSDMVEVSFEPHGLQFAKGAHLSLSYKHCFAPPQQRHWIVYIDGTDRVLEWLLSRDKKGLDEVSADIDHFSRYAVVAN